MQGRPGTIRANISNSEPSNPLADILANIQVPAWMERASCNDPQISPDAWYPNTAALTEEVYAAKQLCAACPVANECFDSALANRERNGYWGGVPFSTGSNPNKKALREAFLAEVRAGMFGLSFKRYSRVKRVAARRKHLDSLTPQERERRLLKDRQRQQQIRARRKERGAERKAHEGQALARQKELLAQAKQIAKDTQAARERGAS